jgi:hypothetical protein
MSRPKPKVLLQYSNKKNFKSEEILESNAIWAVFYQGKPINLKSSSLVSNYPGPKYKKVSFSNPGHAFNLAQKLNAMFKSNEFAVYELTTGKKIQDETH